MRADKSKEFRFRLYRYKKKNTNHKLGLTMS